MSNLDVKLTLIGGPTLLIELAGARFLPDPSFDSPGPYESTGIVLEKKRGPAISNDSWVDFTRTQADLVKSLSVFGIVLRMQTLELGNSVALTI